MGLAFGFSIEYVQSVEIAVEVAGHIELHLYDGHFDMWGKVQKGAERCRKTERQTEFETAEPKNDLYLIGPLPCANVDLCVFQD